MLSIQIDTKSLDLGIYHQFNNIKFSFFCKPYEIEFSIMYVCCTVIRYSRVHRIFKRSELEIVSY